MYMYIANVQVYVYIYTMCVHPYMHLDFWTSASQIMVDFELYLAQSVADYICIQNLPMNIHYYSELGPIKFN